MANTLFHSLLVPTTLVLALLHLSKPSQAQTSFISASPSILPAIPSTSSSSSIPPALSPDMMPLFPIPKHGAGAAASPPESDVLPTIPSSPSPPNPDNTNGDTPDDEPHSAIAPIGSEPMSSAGVRLGNLVNLWVGFFCGALLPLVPIMW